MLWRPRCTWVRPSARVCGGWGGERECWGESLHSAHRDYSLPPLSPPSAEEARAAAPSGPPASAHLH